jgi:hypothetical protein
MNNSTVSTRLVLCPVVFFFKDSHTDVGLPFENCPRYGQPYDATSDDDTIVFLHVAQLTGSFFGLLRVWFSGVPGLMAGRMLKSVISASGPSESAAMTTAATCSG